MSKLFLEKLYLRLLSKGGLVVLAMALLVNLGALFFVDWANNQLEGARLAAVRSREAMSAIERVETLLFEAESAQRGYLTTGKPIYAKPLTDNEGEIIRRLDGLEARLNDNPVQQQLVKEIRAIAFAKLVELNKVIALYQMGRTDEAREAVSTDDGKRLMESFERKVESFLADEDKSRLEWAGRRADMQLGMRYGFATILLINAMLLLAGAYTVMRDLASKEKRVQQEAEAKTRLEEEVKRRTAELRELYVHLQRMQEDERRLVASELHDELGGTLSAIKMDLAMGRDAAAKAGDEKSANRLKRASESLDSAIKFTRKMIEDLRPTLLDNMGLAAALRWQCEQFAERTGCPCHLQVPDEDIELSPEQTIALYRVTQEALTNVLKYAKARRIDISLQRSGSNWRLTIADDGVGMDSNVQHNITSHGITGMRERIGALNGTFAIDGVPGRGTTLVATLPITAS
ncbi:MAG: CHASE3 domain-containing protein [Betaproteobacteria bacterium]|nr:CHASE3 domain-containing protein [Betaproteobacteria bacterium]